MDNSGSRVAHSRWRGSGRVRRRTTTALALLTLATAGAVPATAAPAGDQGLGRYYQQRPDWRSCVTGPGDDLGEELEKAGARCADVTVPLDYADPGGRTITVAISRIAATDRRHRVGPLLLNGGGPGGQTLGDPPAIRAAMKDTAARFDIVGMDPRFVGRSTPLDCGWPVGTSVLSAGESRRSFDRQAAFHKDLAERCHRTNADVLPYVTTRNTARDMDVIRGALREPRISYLGYSYGTYLGTAYTQMFPGRYDRVVLDGALDPRRYQPRLLQGAEAVNDRALAGWAAWAAERHAAYGLGRTRQRVLDTVRDIVRAAAEKPLVVGSGADRHLLDDTEVPFVVFNGVADDLDAARDSFAGQMAVLHKASERRPVEPTPDLAELLEFGLTGAQSHYGSVQSAILCGDAAAPRDPEVYWRDIERIRERHPLTGPLTNNIGPCAFWSAPPREGPVRVERDVPALIVSATGDPRTPHEGAKALHGMLPGSALLTVQGANRHGIYGFYGDTCVDTRVNAYFRTGRLPAGDPVCHREPSGAAAG